MVPIRTILHPTDFKDRSSYAFRFACALSRDYGAKLVVLHVAEPPSDFEESDADENSQRWIEEARALLQRINVPKCHIRAIRQFETGDPPSEILRVAKEIPAELIVMGTHGGRDTTEEIMGSVAERVVRGAECLVLTVTTPVVEEADVHAVYQAVAAV